MQRREFIALLGSAATWPIAARAQPQKTLRIGMASVLPRNNPTTDAFLKRLRALGYDEEHNLAFEYVKVPSAAEYPDGMKEVVRRHVDIIIAQGPEEILKAAMAATNTTPIVMIAIDFDPFARGYVTSLAHPSGNVTGIFFQQIELSAKRLEIAKELIPGLQSAGVFWDVSSADQFQSLKNAGQKLGIQSFRGGNERSTVQLRSCLGTGARSIASHADPSDIRDFSSGSPADCRFHRGAPHSGNVRISRMGRRRRPGVIRGQPNGVMSGAPPSMSTNWPRGPRPQTCQSSSRQSSSSF